MANNKRKDPMIMPAFGQLPPVSGTLPATPVDMLWMAFSFMTNGGSNPLAVNNFGHPFTVIRLSAGLYTISLGAGVTIATGGYQVRKVASFLPVLGKGAAGNALRAHPGLIAENLGNATLASTLQVRLEDATGVATDLAAGTDNRVNCLLAIFQGGR